MKKAKNNLDSRLEEFLTLTKKQITLEDLCSKLDLSGIEVLSLKRLAKEKGYIIASEIVNGVQTMYNQGETKTNDEDIQFITDQNNEFKFMAISNTLLGNKAQQLTILRDIYDKAKELGIKNVIVCGNLLAENYSVKSIYHGSNFITDQESRIDYIVKNWPQIDGIKTYFVTNKLEEKSKISVGNRIATQRNDMIFLGEESANFKIDDLNVKVISSDQDQTYTVSYRAEQFAKAFRSEDKPDILLLGGTNQHDSFNYREADIYTIPSLASTTKKMENNRKANVVGAVVITIKNGPKKKKTNSYVSSSTLIPYYQTIKDEYKTINAKPVGTSLANIEELKEQCSITEATRFFNGIKNNSSVEDYMSQKHMSYEELRGLVQLCNEFGKEIEIVKDNNNDLKFHKQLPKNIRINKPNINSDDIVENHFLAVSDTHIGNIGQQIGLLNKLYKEAYDRGNIKVVFHGGDMVDGLYKTRSPYPEQNFLHGFDEQARYLINMYPKVDGIKTIAITGNHDKTHHVNGGATLNTWVPLLRDDIEIIGQDQAFLNFDGVKIEMRHPDDGSADSLSYRSQKMIDKMPSGTKANIFLTGHYHKYHYMLYRNEFGIVLPCLCSQTNFELTHGLQPTVGGVFFSVYSNKKTGQIDYITVEPRIFGEKDLLDEAGKDKRKVKQLVIN